MTKKYLIDEDKSWTSNGYRLCEPSDAKEVEVLGDDNCDFAFDDFRDQSSLQYFSDYLKANNLQIIKIKE